MTRQHMPAELEPHERTLVAWPCRDEIYPGPRMAEARAAHAEVARALLASPLEAIPRYQVLCFDDAPPGWLERPFEFQEVWVTWSRHLVEPMLATVHLQRADVSRLAGLLDRILDRR